MTEKRALTRRWWREAVDTCEFVTSALVQHELLRGTSEHVSARLALIHNLEMVEVNDRVEATAGVYMQRKLMPANPPADALHLALASHYNCDVLITWNYRHLANSTKLHHIRLINARLGLPVPLITTPRRLLGGEDELA
ncbi:MAG TPA: PIN domain-containing protein [Longimicrobium sp.]|nr:PIN domain-containing protein [Longimicrobium sp.]